MIEIFDLYKWTILAACAAAPCLSLLGAQVLARGWTIRALIVSQASSTGVLVGIAVCLISASMSGSFSAFVLVLLVSLLFTVLVGIALAAIDRPNSPHRLANLISVYVVLIALGALLGSLSPELEMNQARAFAGDIATVSDIESRFTIALSMGLLGWVWLYWNDLSFDAFSQTVLFKDIERWRAARHLFMAFVALAISIQAMGLIFALGSLFVPISLVEKKSTTLKNVRLDVVLSSLAGTLLGFAASMAIGNLPTAPSIVGGQILAAGTLRCLRGFSKQRRLSK